MDTEPRRGSSPPDTARDDVRARAVASYQESTDVHGVAMPLAMSLGKTVTDFHPLEDGSLCITTDDGATRIVDAAERTAMGAEWAETSGYQLTDAIQLVQAQDAGRRSVRLARKLGRDNACVPLFYRDENHMQRTGSKSITLAPRRATASRSTGRAARPAANHRHVGSRRSAASSTTSSADPGDSDPDPPPLAAPVRLAPSPRAVFAFGLLSTEQRGEVVA